jgi:polar amino acid transport system permease protein
MDLIGLLSWGPDGWGDEIAEGALVTVGLALATLPFGLTLGLAIALAKNSTIRPLVALGNLYTTVFRGLPELLTLLIIYYGGQMLAQSAAESVNEAIGAVLQWLAGLGLAFDQETIDYYVDGGEPLQVNSFLAGMIALGVVFSAYASEIFLGALKGITQGQIEASRALGLSRGLTLRLVVLPQLWRFALPGLSNLWLVLMKETSLVSAIALSELLHATSVAVGVTKQPFFFYLVACFIYLFFAMVSSVGLGRLDSWANRGRTRALA